MTASVINCVSINFVNRLVDLILAALTFNFAKIVFASKRFVADQILIAMKDLFADKILLVKLNVRTHAMD